MSRTIRGAEILDVGTWPASTGTLTVPSSAIDAIVASFDALGLSRKVPLKFGHNDGQPVTDGQPALGWVSRVWREGSKLLADFVDMPEVVYAAIQKKLYKTVSVELLRDVQAGTRKLPWVLDAVALLGADQPAVGTLKDLEALTLTRKPVMQARARVALRRVIQFSTTGGPTAMTEDEVKALLKKQADELTANFTSALTAKTTEIQANADKQIKDAKDAAAKTAAEAHRSQIKAKFETAVKAEALLPAKRESFYKFNRVDDDVTVITIKLEDVDAYITEFADKAKLAAASKIATKGQEGADPAEATLSAAQIVVHRARKLCFSRNQDPNKFEHINAATVEVLKADKALGESYKRLEDAPAAA